jgi:hypothetical protein
MLTGTDGCVTSGIRELRNSEWARGIYGMTDHWATTFRCAERLIDHHLTGQIFLESAFITRSMCDVQRRVPSVGTGRLVSVQCTLQDWTSVALGPPTSGPAVVVHVAVFTTVTPCCHVLISAAPCDGPCCRKCGIRKDSDAVFELGREKMCCCLAATRLGQEVCGVFACGPVNAVRSVGGY